MTSFRLNNLAITIEKEGAGQYTKASYPIRFGKHSEIKTSEYEFQFNLKGEIKFIRGLNVDWSHPSEWLKRTDGNDWVFYSVGSASGHNGIFDCLGEYYLPCLPYPSNSIWQFNPFADSNILKAFAGWSQLYANLSEIPRGGIPSKIKDFLSQVTNNNENILYQQAQKLHAIIGRRVSVLPPDTRHVDYEVIPLIIADGCLYQCDFCCVKSHQRFQPRSRDNILQQIRRLKTFYDRNLDNYKALFLGDHDALGAGDELICMAAAEAIQALGLKNPILFLFGSVDSLLKAKNELLEELNDLSFYTYINIGFESIDAPTLASINKPLEVSKIRDAFRKMLEINRDYANLEITANFLLGEQLSPDHNRSLAELLSSVPDPLHGKGAIYLSPLINSQNKPELLHAFFEIKNQSRLPTYIYLIQRL